jgi:hypothetical protein
LNQKLYKGLKGEGLEIDEEYINKYPGVLVIATLAVKPDFVKEYKVGFFTNDILGKAFAVFYISRATNINDRQNEILQRIVNYKKLAIRDDHKRN